MDLFEKCREFYSNPESAKKFGYPMTPQAAMASGLFPFFIPIDQAEGPEAIIHGKHYIMIGSNNYLGLTVHPKVKEAAVAAVRKYGTSCTGSRFLNGTLHMHIELEEKLAAFVSHEAALVYSTGFQVNIGSIPAVMDQNDIIVTDKDVHASIVDGVRMAKVQKNTHTRYFKHNDAADLEKILKSLPAEPGKLVIIDGVYSMGGDIAPLPEIVRVCKAYGARLFCDDAHSLGVLGRGRGTGAHFGMEKDVDLVMGTFSKSFASVGGFVAGPKEVILRTMGYNIGPSETPIIPIVIGDQFKAIKAWKVFFDEGIYANVALPPAVTPEFSCLRTSYMATHTDAQLDRVLEVFDKVKHQIHIGE
ncbi:MAG: pyridoxal phosphate-dependent aminotransferase family protein [Candidatus Aminicenantes bacterium]|nr:pyridoxal phosphate-dependent aminotransferase family protein [Candidatus Aminicenantes bacterium]